MPTKAHLEGNKRYHATLDEIKVRVPKGRKAEIKTAADAAGESVNGYIIRAVELRMGTPAPFVRKSSGKQ